MKINILCYMAAVLVSIALLHIGCKKKGDTTAPVITLIGGSTINQSLPAIPGSGTWHDPGYTASDDQDGNITASVIVTGEDSVNPNVKGSYFITYTVSDKAGNFSPARIRTVNIVNDAEVFAGLYTTSSDTSQSFSTWVDTIIPPPAITTSDTVNNTIFISNFGGHDSTGAYKVSAFITSDSTISVTGLPAIVGDSATITGFISGSVISKVPPTAIDIQYQWKYKSNISSNITHYRR